MSPEISISHDEATFAISRLLDTPTSYLNNEVIIFEGVHIFGENHAYPRSDEIIEYSENSSSPTTHILLELPEDFQPHIDDFLSESGDSATRIDLTKFGGPYERILRFARDKKIKVLTSEMHTDRFVDWGRDNPDTVKMLMESGNLNETALVVTSLPARCKFTGEKIRQIYEEIENSQILVSCGAKHVAGIAAGFYGVKLESFLERLSRTNPDWEIEKYISRTPAHK